MRRPPAVRLWVRLGAASVAIALGAVALAAGLTAVLAGAEVSRLVDQQRTKLTDAVAVAAAAAWDRADSWRSADITPVLDLAGRSGAQVEVRDAADRPIVSSMDPSRTAWTAIRTRPVLVGGNPVGTVTVRFTGTGIGRAAQRLEMALLWGIAAASGLAAVLASLVGIVTARRITRPVDRVIASAQAMARGDRAVRVGRVPAVPELRELAAAFDAMADTVAREEELRRRVVADLAHELRTPVAVLQAEHEALLDGVIEPTPAQLSSVRDEVLRLGTMIEDLHGLATAEAAALALDRRPTDLAVIAAAAGGSLRSRFDAAGITLQQQTQSAPVSADPRWMHQVVTNLLGNALKFTPDGGTVTLDVDRQDGLARLRVTDTGVGIPPDELPRVFDRFWRGRDATAVAGSGIGLAIVAELVRAHDGDVAVSSEPGLGTTVTVTLPAG